MVSGQDVASGAVIRGATGTGRASRIGLAVLGVLALGVGVTFLVGNVNAWALLGDWLVLVGLAVSVLIYLSQQSDERQRDMDAVVAMLRAVRDGMKPTGTLYFNAYDEPGARHRAQQDFDHIMEYGFGQVFPVPVEPLTALIAQPGDGELVHRETIEAVNIALWRIDCFNQIVQQLADFNVLHAAEIADRDLPQPRREAIARAARAISTMLHLGGIGDASWYSDLKAALEKNIDDLVSRPV